MTIRKWICILATLLLGLVFSLGTARTGMAQDGGVKIFLPRVTNGAVRIPINFSPYVDGQNPNYNVIVSETQLRERLNLIAPYTNWVRSFGCGNGLEKTGQIARELGLKVAVTAWIGTDATASQQQVDCLIAEANAGRVDLAIVGSEAILRGDVSAATLIAYLDQVKAAIPASVPVATADVYTVFLNHPTLADHVDWIFANLYPFWEGYDSQYAVAMVDYMYGLLADAFPGKPVSISETGWPSCGSNGGSVGSLANEAAFFNQVESWARDKNVLLFYFEGLDETWKTAYEGPSGACWGIFDKNGAMKAGLRPFFDGVYTSYSLTPPLTCDTSEFSFDFTYVPPIGSTDNVTGRACGVFHKDKKVLTYIKVAGNWWVKPTLASPTVPVAMDGSFSVDTTTGGIDEQATEIKMYLLPVEADPFGDLSPYPMIDVVRTP